MEKANTLNCGDINLTACLMSVGIPLSESDPCSLVLRDNGRNYGRFHIMGHSIDGVYNTEALMDQWKGRRSTTDISFQALMDFVRSGTSNGCILSSEWFDYAHTYLVDMGENMTTAPSSIKDIPDFVNLLNNSITAHIFAFVYNRDYCWDLIQGARRRVMITKGKAHACIDTNLPKWKKNELLARLEG